MKAWVLHGVGDISFEEVRIPVLKEDEVLVRVCAAGICGSDIPRIYETGAHRHPLICGHEFSGEVVCAAEDGLEKWKGKRVGVFPLIPCGKCSMCQSQKYEMCRNYDYLGSRRDGGFAEYVAVPEWNLVEIPENISFEQAAMLEPTAVAVHALRQAFSVDAFSKADSQTIAVVGLGTIGMLLIMALKDAGYNSILAVGNKEFQRKQLERMGIESECFCNVKEADADIWFKEKTNGSGADVFFECVGKAETVSLALKNTAPSGKIVLVGNPHEHKMMFERNTYWSILRHQITVHGTWNSSFRHNRNDDWAYVLRRLCNGKLHPEMLITHRFGLQNLDEGLHIMKDKTEDSCKIMGVFS